MFLQHARSQDVSNALQPLLVLPAMMDGTKALAVLRVWVNIFASLWYQYMT